MAFKKFSEYITEASKEITIAWGRYNPPTIGHEKLMDATKKVARGGAYRIYASQSTDSKKNPLEYTSKIKYMRKMFPRHARAIILDKNIKTIFDLLYKLYEEGYTKVNLVAGSDRVPEYEALTNKYNGVKGRHGFYNFEGGVNVISAGERDPDADGAAGMSGTKLRTFAIDNDFQGFMKGLPSGFKEAKALFNSIRTGLGLKESHDFRSHVQLESVSDTREAYISGDLFKVGDEVVIKESDEVGTVVVLGSNYVLVEMCDGKKVRKWLEAVDKLDEVSSVDRTKERIEREKEADREKHARMMDRAKQADAQRKEVEPRVESFNSFSEYIKRGK